MMLGEFLDAMDKARYLEAKALGLERMHRLPFREQRELVAESAKLMRGHALDIRRNAFLWASREAVKRHANAHCARISHHHCKDYWTTPFIREAKAAAFYYRLARQAMGIE